MNAILHMTVIVMAGLTLFFNYLVRFLKISQYKSRAKRFPKILKNGKTPKNSQISWEFPVSFATFHGWLPRIPENSGTSFNWK